MVWSSWGRPTLVDLSGQYLDHQRQSCTLSPDLHCLSSSPSPRSWPPADRVMLLSASNQRRTLAEWCCVGTLGESTEGFAINYLHQSLKDGRCSTQPKWHPIVLTQAPLGWWTLSYGLIVSFYLYLVDCIRVVKSSQSPVKIAAYLVSVGQLFCFIFLYRLCCWNKIFVD